MVSETLLSFVTDALYVAAQVGPVAIGFAAVYRTTGHLHFAYAGIWTLISYVYGSRLEAGDGFVVAFAWTAAVSIVASLACFAAYRSLKGEFSVVLQSFGIYLALTGLQLMLWGPSQEGIDPTRVLAGVWTIAVSGHRVTVPLLYVLHGAVLLITALAFAWFLGRTRLGGQVTAVAENRELAKVTGISVLRIELIAYVVSALLAAISAAVQVTAVGSDVYTGTSLFIDALVIVIVAGRVVIGAAVASLLFGAVHSGAQVILGTELVTLATYAALLALILRRPAGVFTADLVFPAKVSDVTAERRLSATTSPG